MIKRLTEIYNCRLKALIGYGSTSFTEEIVRFMFSHFEKLADSWNEVYKDVLKYYIWDIVSYVPGDGRQESGNACHSSVQLMMRLENYIRANVELLGLNVSDKDDDYRKALGHAFTQKVKECPLRFPAKLLPKKFLSQLNYTTMYRNKFAHHENSGGSVVYPRYIIFLAYEVLLSYLLYTFYFMALAPEKSYPVDPLEHIND